MRHLWGGGGSSIIVLNHTIVELRRHRDNHVIVVWVEVATLWHIETEGRRVVIAGEQVVWVVDETWLMGTSFGQIGRPHTHIGILSLMHSHVGWPDSVMDLTLSKVPLLEEVTAVLLMTRMNLGQVDHSLLELHLGETLVDKKIVLLMDSSVATLASSREDLETATKCGGVPRVPCDLRGEVGVAVVHADGVNLLFVTLDSIGSTNVVSEDPGLSWGFRARESVSGTTCEEDCADCC